MKKCPLTGDGCYQHDCEWYIQVIGKDPQTEADLSKWGCSIAWIPVLLIENSQMQRQTAQSIQSFRNEVVKNNDKAIQAALAIVETRNPGRLVG